MTTTATRTACNRIPLTLAAKGRRGFFDHRDLRRRWRRTVGFPLGYQINQLLSVLG